MHVTVILPTYLIWQMPFGRTEEMGAKEGKTWERLVANGEYARKMIFFFWWKHSTTVTWMPQIWTHEMGSVTALPERHGPAQLLFTSHLAKCQLGDLQDVTLNSQFLFIVVPACARLVESFCVHAKKKNGTLNWTRWMFTYSPHGVELAPCYALLCI